MPLDSDPPAPAARAGGWALAAFLAVNLLIGLVSFEAFRDDDSDLILFSQTLELGYHDQPPLYSWLCALAVRALGLNLFALALLKTAVLAGVAASLWWAARLALGDGRRAALAAATTLLLPFFSWHALTYLTHSNLLFIACAATVAVFCRLRRDGRTRDYLLLGPCLALGVLAKYSYPLFALALALAGLTVPGFRARLFDRRLLLSLAAAGLLVAPHLAWLAGHSDWVMHELRSKTGVSMEARTLADTAGGTAHLALNLVMVLTPLWLLPVAFPEALRRPDRPRDLPGDANRLLGRFLLAAVVLLAGMAVVCGTTRFHERWLEPLALFGPLYFFGRMRGAELPELRLRRLAWTCALAAVALTVVRAGAVARADLDYSNWPRRGCYESAARQLRAAVGDDVTVVAAEREIAGNLRWWWPQARHLCIWQPLYLPEAGAGPRRYVVVWDATETDLPPAKLDYWLKRCWSDREPGIGLPAGVTAHFIEPPPSGARKSVGRLAYTVIDVAPKGS